MTALASHLWEFWRAAGLWFAALLFLWPLRRRENFRLRLAAGLAGGVLLHLPVGLLSPAVAVGGILHIGWLPKAYFVGITALALFAVVYANTGGRFRKK